MLVYIQKNGRFALSRENDTEKGAFRTVLCSETHFNHKQKPMVDPLSGTPWHQSPTSQSDGGGTTNIHQLRKGVVKYTDPSSSPSSLHQDARWTRLCLGPERKLLRLESSSASGHPTDGFRWPLPRWFDSTLEYGLGTALFTVCVSRVWRPARDGPARCGDDCIAA